MTDIIGFVSNIRIHKPWSPILVDLNTALLVSWFITPLSTLGSLWMTNDNV